MGVDTKLFIAVDRTKFLDLMPKLMKDLNEWQRFELDTVCKKADMNRLQFLFSSEKNKDKWSNGVTSVTTNDFGSFFINFRINGESRNLFVTHTCSNDYSDIYKGDKIIFSLGKWGICEEIMMVIADSIKEFGDVYYIENDCDDNWVKL